MNGMHKPPLVSSKQISHYDAFVAADDDYMARPSETDPHCFELLPSSRQVPVPFDLAGVHAHEPTANPRKPHTNPGPSPSYAVTAAYTPDGTLEWPLRTLVARLAVFDEKRHTADDIDACYERKLDKRLSQNGDTPPTEWIDSTYQEEAVDGHRRTTFSHRQPLLYQHGRYDGGVSRPVWVFAFAFQLTDCGFIETGIFLSPDPDPGRPLEIVETVADTLTTRVQRLPRPTPNPDWPRLHLRDISYEEMVADVQDHLNEWADEGRIDRGRLIELIREEYDIPEDVIITVISELREHGDIREVDAAHYGVA